MSRLDLVVLGFVNRQPMYGYEIISYFERRGLEMWTKVKTPSVYKALQRLKKKGYIAGELKQEGNTPSRKVFTITDQGSKYFMKLLRLFLWGKDQSQTPIDFWNALRFIQKNITHSEFMEIIENRFKMMEEFDNKMKERQMQAAECGKLQDFPFYAKIMHETMMEMKVLQVSTLKRIKNATMLPENQRYFKEEIE